MISGGIWNGNYYNPEIPKGAQSKGDSIHGLVGCFRFYWVDNLIVRDAILYKPATYALAATNVTHVLYAVVIDNYQHDPKLITWAGPGNIGTINILSKKGDAFRSQH